MMGLPDINFSCSKAFRRDSISIPISLNALNILTTSNTLKLFEEEPNSVILSTSYLEGSLTCYFVIKARYSK